MPTKEPSIATIQLRSIRKYIGTNIRTYRTAKNISLRKLGSATNISINNLDLFELGRGKLGIEQLAKISTALDIEMIMLIKQPSTKNSF